MSSSRRVDRIDEGAQPLRARERCGRDVCVRRVDERELARPTRSRVSANESGSRRVGGAPERTDGAIAVRRRDEHHAGAARRPGETRRRHRS